ncbi:MAG: hypothetical protein WC980_06185 [Candidatus Brocadiia bacterium]
MAVWRKKYLELFPDLPKDFQEDGIYIALHELVKKAKIAYDVSDNETLSRIFGFAEWCLKQNTGELNNAACVSFYEHLGEATDKLVKFSPWISPEALELASGILKWAFSEDDFLELKHAVEKKR